MKNIHNIGIIGAGSVPLASTLHKFHSPAIGEAFEDLKESLESARIGVASLADIPYIKSLHFPKVKVTRLMLNKSGFYYLTKLSRYQRKELIRATRDQMPLVPLKDWLASIFLDMEDFLGCSFVWGHSANGHDYWEKIATEYRYLSEKGRITPEAISDLVDQITRNNE